MHLEGVFDISKNYTKLSLQKLQTNNDNSNDGTTLNIRNITYVPLYITIHLTNVMVYA